MYIISQKNFLAFSTKIEDCYTTKGGQAKFECKVKDKTTKVLWYYGNWKEVQNC